MRILSNTHIRRCEMALAKGVIRLADDLRMVDATDLVAWLRAHRFGNVAAIVNSSTELMFKPGTLRFSLSGGAELTWSGRLGIHLDMEFHHLAIDCYFRLQLEQSQAAVGITYLAVDGAPCRSAATSERFLVAFADAMIESNERLAATGLCAPPLLRKPGANQAG